MGGNTVCSQCSLLVVYENIEVLKTTGKSDKEGALIKWGNSDKERAVVLSN